MGLKPAVVLEHGQRPVAKLAELELAGVTELQLQHGSELDKVRAEPEFLEQAEPKCL